MIQRRFAWLMPIIGMLGIGLTLSRAQEIRQPMPPIWHPPVWMPPINQLLTIDSVAVDATITDGVAQTDVTQVWRNDTDRAQEGMYLFPVPPGATLSDFALYDGDRKMSARLLDGDEASQTYEQIVSHLKDPALLRYVGRNTYQVKLYPVPPHTTRRITLKFSEVLRSEEANTRKYLFSFAADSLSENKEHASVPHNATVRITLKDADPITNIYSPTQEVSIRHQGDHQATVSWEAKNTQVSTDFLLTYGTAHDKTVGLGMLAYNVSLPSTKNASFPPSNSKRDSGYFLLMASPKTDLSEAQIQPKRIVLVLDRSGSMSGDKIEQARGALSFVLNHLRPNDEFNVMTFNESVDMLSEDKLLTATPDNLKRALAFVKDITAQGGTNINEALTTALKLLPTETTASRQNMVVFLTDGLPTIGETNQTRITETAQRLSKAANVRLFDFGVGYDVDVPFLDRLAEQNHGDADYVRPEENIEAKVAGFYQKVAAPVLTDVQLSIDGVTTADVYPRPDSLPDLFAGSQLMIAGRYVGQGPVTARLSGLVNGKPESYTLNVTLPAVADTNDFLPRLWATRKIGYLLDAIRLRQTDLSPDGVSSSGDHELISEVVRLSQAYGIVTPYTSFLVTDDTDRPNPSPIPMFEGAARRGGLSDTNGAGATTNSQIFRSMKSATAAPVASAYAGDKDAATINDRIQTVGAKTFILRGDTWTDSTFDRDRDTKITTVAAYSPAHFVLLRKLPSLGTYSALGPNVLIRLTNGQILKISNLGGLKELDDKALRAIIG